MSEAKKCPKCSGEMESGWLKVPMNAFTYSSVEFSSSESKTRFGSSKTTPLVAYSCKVCGYVEIFRVVEGKT